MSSRRTVLRAGVVAVGIACLLVWLRSRPRPPEERRPTKDPTAGLTSFTAPPEPRWYRPPPAKSGGGTTAGRPNPIIASVRVDKTEVCRGEENFAHVDVDTVDGTDADLRIWLVGDAYLDSTPTGGRLPIRMFGPMNKDAPPMVMVSGRGGTHAEQPLPLVKVKDCDADPFLQIHVTRVDGETRDLYQFEAALRGRAVSDVTWSFGDGATTVSHDPKAQHGYGERAQRSAYSEFLITATVKGDGGRTLHGYRTLEFANRDHRARRGGS